MTAGCVNWTTQSPRAYLPYDDAPPVLDGIAGRSPALLDTLASVEKVAPTDATVLITGETGTGKELMARAIHRRSRRASRPFIAVNCAAIPSELIAAELFGHERGAFTGAVQRRTGRFEMAAGGTLFLDEIGELPLDTQVMLLRVLQERELERIGGTRTIPVDVRIVAATNRDLEAEVLAGRFRSDLFYRLNVFPVEMPPLRARRGDVAVLARHFALACAARTGKTIDGIAPATLALLESHSWPGNVRDLQNVIERAVILCDGGELEVDASWLRREGPSASGARSALAETLGAQERALIEAALAACSGRVAGPRGAAARLGLPPSTLESRIRSLGIGKQRFRTF